MPTVEVRFPSGARTDCVIEAGALARLPELCEQAGLRGTAGLICDARLAAVQSEAVLSLRSHFGEVLARPVNEVRKTLAEVEAMCEGLAARGVQRDGFVVAVGGGVLTDLAGLAAALYLRGVPWASVPTTLLAQVDAGLGGKTGANLRAGKNLVGAFHQPRLVVCDPLLLATLPERERWSGLAEVVKCALLEGGGLLEACERDLERAAGGDAAALAPLVEGSVRLKARIVAADEREGGQRAFLNLGHTVGHALEAATGYERFAHGEAVALGLRGMLALSETMPDRDRAEKLVARLQISAERTLDADQREAALAAMSRDKKARGGSVRFVVLERIGAAKLREVNRADCAGALAAALA
ncbi:MAG TPA: 3-dehydroquinate synthase family protein [Myxococcales bacterium]|nr:3-dehydroquinate synthase family protein [Myxococcales bacterium]